MSVKNEQIKGYRSLGWLGKIAIIIGLIISLSSLGCGGSKTQESTENASKQVQSESSGDSKPAKTRPRPSPQESYYTEAISQQVSKWNTIMDSLGSLIENPRIEDKDWSSQVKAQVDQMRTLIDGASKLSPPDKYKDVQAVYMKAISELTWVANNLTTAIDNLDSNVLTECNQRMENGSNYLNEVGKTMDRLSN